jgi:hypothetical protein
MTAAQKPDPGTGVQMVEKVAVGALPPAVRQQLELRKLSNQIAGKLAEMNWGKELDLETRRAVADWGRQFRVDVTTEIHVLGKNIYLNAAFYLRQLAEMIEAELVEYAYADHVEPDDRLAQMGPEGEGETTRRLRERLMHGIPDKVKSAVVFRVKLRSMDREIVGSKWCGTGKVNQYNKLADPVGEEFPVETSESRAARRAMRQLASHVPKHRAAEIEMIETATEQLGERMAGARHAFRDREAELSRPPAPMALPAAGDPYGPVATVPAPAKEAERVTVNNSAEKIDRVAAAPRAPSFADLAASVDRLLKNDRVSEADRARLTIDAANAKDEGDLTDITADLEKIIVGDGELGL